MYYSYEPNTKNKKFAVEGTNSKIQKQLKM